MANDMTALTAAREWAAEHVYQQPTRNLGSPADRAQEQPCYDCGQREADHVDGRCSRYRPAARAQDDLADLRERLAALAALEEHIGESCGNASHNIRSVLDGTYDPRPDAVRYGLNVVTA